MIQNKKWKRVKLLLNDNTNIPAYALALVIRSIYAHNKYVLIIFMKFPRRSKLLYYRLPIHATKIPPPPPSAQQESRANTAPPPKENLKQRLW